MSQPTAPTTPLPPSVVALIPMRNVVLFPHVLVPISVGRAKSIAALEHALAAGSPVGIVLHRVDESGQRSFGYNVATREYGDMLEMGVIDPAKVTRLALQNAASIASLVLTIDCMVANAPKKASPADGSPGINPEMY